MILFLVALATAVVGALVLTVRAVAADGYGHTAAPRSHHDPFPTGALR